MNFGQSFDVVSKYMTEKDDIEKVAEILTEGGVICYPTDTVWGIGCDATHPEAIRRIRRIKGHKSGRGYVLLVDSIERLRHHVKEVHPRVETLLLYHTRPLTIIYSGAQNLPDEAYAPDGSVAIRLTKDPLCVRLIQAIDAPLVSTSANVSGQPFPGAFGEISSQIIEQVDYVSKERRWDKSPARPSTIATVNDEGILDFIRE